VARRDFGSIRQRGKRWQVRYTDPTGQVRTKTFATKADGTRFLALVRADLERGDWFDPAAGSLLLAEYAEQWVEHRKVRGRPLAPRTRELYRWLLRKHVMPHLGDVELRRLTDDAVRRWHRDLIGPSGPGAVTASKAYRLLHAICASAVEERHVSLNPCAIRGASSESSPERPVIGIPLVFALADAVSRRWRALVLLAAFCGLRFGELAALQRQDIDLDDATVTVRASVAELPRGVRHVGPPKSEAGRRTVTIPDAILDDLRRHMAQFVAATADAPVFIGPKGGPLRNANFGRSIWRPATENVGIPGLHFHDLRHVGATLVAATGASTRELMRRIGHSSPDAALRYQHATRERDVVIARALSEMIVSAGLGEPSARSRIGPCPRG
jgi:integrase